MTRWMIFSTLATALFLGLYLLLFRRDRWLQLSRMYLLTTLAFSLLYPLMRLPTFELPLSTIDYNLLPVIEFTATPSVAENGVRMMDNKTGNAHSILEGIYLLGATIALTILLVQVIRTALAIRRMPSQGKHLHLLDDNTEPYSFFNHIVIGTNGLDDGQLQCILAHEELHVRQRHSLDVLLMRLMCCATWFNPFSYLYIRELRKVHEYQADDAVLASHGREAYLGLLYREATGFGYGHIKNNFQSINIKKRIEMMNKKKSRFGAWKLLAVLPVAALVMAFGCRTVDAEVPDDTYNSTLLTVNYQRVGGKALPFGGIGYNKVCSHVNVENGFTERKTEN